MDKLILRENGVQFLSAYKEIESSREEMIEGQKDLIFILSHAEWKEWIRAYIETGQAIQALETGDEQLQAMKNAAENINLELAPLFFLSFAQRRFGELTIVGCVPEDQEDYYVVFFCQEEERTEKMARVAEAVRQYEEKRGNSDTPLFT